MKMADGSLYLEKKRTPEVILGPFVTEGMEWLICDFSELLLKFKNDKTFDENLTKRFSKEFNFHYNNPVSFQRNEVEIILSMTEKCLIFRAMGLRLHFIFMEIEKLPKFSYHWFRIIDYHINLFISIRKSSYYDDESLQDETKNESNFVTSMLEQFYPTHKQIFYWGDLPCMVFCLDSSNLWYDVRPKNKDLISSIVHIFLCKTLAQKCQLRNFQQIMLKYCQKYPIILKLLKCIIPISLLGNYPFCNQQTGMKFRMETYTVFSSIWGFDDTRFMDWVRDNITLVRFCCKEFNRFCIDCDIALEKTLFETTTWKKVKIGLSKTMDIIRFRLSSESFTIDIGELDINSDLTNFHQTFLVSMWKLKKNNFLEIIVAEMGKLKEKGRGKRLTKKKFWDVKAQYITSIDTELIDLITNREALFKGVRVPLKWLKVIGVSKMGVNTMRNLMDDYIVKHTADNSLYRRLLSVYNNRPRDFFLIFQYFNRMMDIRSLREFYFPQSVKEQQELALRTKHFITPGDPLPPSTYTFSFCTLCNRWAHPVVNNNEPKTCAGCFAYGSKKTLYDHISGDTYCGKKINPTVMKKILENTSTLDPDLDTLKEEVDKSKDNQEVVLCSRSKLVHVNMLGTIKKIRKTSYALCTRCGVLMNYDGECFSNNGITCVLHRSEPLANLDLISDTSIKVYSLVDEQTIRCDWCWNVLQKKSMNSITLYDDSNHLFECKKYFLCATDYKSFKRVSSRSPIRTTSIFRKQMQAYVKRAPTG
jgi:hypothetical protein